MLRPVSFLVDPSMYGPAYALPRDVYGDLDRVVRPDLHFHYSTPVCAQRWLDVCDDPAYGHGLLLDQVSASMPSVAGALREEVGESPLALTSLGTGDGAVDERTLLGLAAHFRIASWTGLDFSFELLRRSAHRLAASEGLPRGMELTAVCGDFTGLGSPTSLGRSPGLARLFTLMGFTLGNYPEGALLRKLALLMEPGDHLLLDARLHGLGPLPGDGASLGDRLPGLLVGYDRESVRRFVFGPVEVATLASAEDVEIGYRHSRQVTEVPNALNLLIHCTGLDSRTRLGRERVRRDRLDLAVTTRYHLPDLLAWIASMGFTLAWHGATDDAALLLLRR